MRVESFNFYSWKICGAYEFFWLLYMKETQDVLSNQSFVLVPLKLQMLSF